MILSDMETHRPMEQKWQHRTKSPHIWSINIWQERHAFSVGERIVFNKCCWENWITIWKRMKLNPYIMPIMEINSKWIWNLQILRRNRGKKNLFFVLWAISSIWKQSTNKSKNKQVGPIKLKGLCTAKYTINKTEKEA